VDASGDAYIAGTTYSTDLPVKNPYQKTNNATKLAESNAFVSKLNLSGTAILYSTYLGGTGQTPDYSTIGGDSGNGIAVDASGDAYVTGQACSTNFPVTTGAFQTVNNTTSNTTGYNKLYFGCNAFVTKLSPAGSSLVYSTYLGGSGAIINSCCGNISNYGDSGSAIAVDGSGNAYIAGFTDSPDFPVTPGVVQSANHASSNGTTNAFISKLNPTGTGLVYSTCLGGNGEPSGFNYGFATTTDAAYGLALDSKGNAYVTGAAYSSNFPVTAGAFQPTSNAISGQGGSNGFVAKLNPNATQLVYSTYLGGSGQYYYSGPHADYARAIAVNAAGNAFVTGETDSTDFPVTKGAFQTTKGGSSPNAFVTEFNAAGTALLYSTYLGGSGNNNSNDADVGYGIAVDGAGDAYVTGQASSDNFPITTSGFQTTNGGTTNAFLTKLNPNATELIYSTYLGGSLNDLASGIALDNSGNAYIAGQAYSSNFPVSAGAYQTTNKAHPTAGSNAFIAKLSIGDETTTVVTPSGNPVPQGTPVTLTATVTAPYSASNPTGTVTFTIDGSLAATVALVAGTAKYSTGTLGLGKHPVIAAYSGATGYQSSQAAYTQSIGIATPILAPAAGTYPSLSVTITDATPGAAIYYTINGGTPTSASTPYTAPITETAPGTYDIKAVAVLSGYASSTVTSAAYVIKPGTATPVIAPAGGINFTEAKLVTITDSATGAAIYYTTNGTTPTSASTKYTVPFLVGANETVTAIAIASGDSPSTPRLASFTFAGVPTMLAGPATAITASSATLNAFTSTQGIAGTYYFQYGSASTALSATTVKTALNSSPAVQVSTAITGLQTKTTYYYQFVVTTAAGSALGPVLTFTTN
jgi:hypothetical protein